jgi:hypothetical protein
MPASRTFGDIEVTAVSDGRLKTSIDVVLDIERAETERLVGGAENAEQFLAVNSFLIRHGEIRAELAARFAVVPS